MNFTALSVQNYKGIKAVYLCGLSHINVICGKNSSGKSSILEGLSNKEVFGVGEAIDELVLHRIISNVFSKWGDPIPRYATSWFSSFLKEYLASNTYLFNNEWAEFTETLMNSFNNTQWRHNYGLHPDLRTYFSPYFYQILNGYNPILLPPKRRLESNTKIELNEELRPDGKGCVNKLFYLKNQDRESNDSKTYYKIYETFKSITNIHFNIIPTQDHTLKLVFQVGKTWLSADDCGLGLRDLLIIITYVFATDYNVYLIEEPENHLHADFQKKLIYYLLKPATNKQFILSTHSPVFLDSNTADKIYYCWFDKDQVKVSDQTTLSKITNTLGHTVTESLTSDAIIFVEGPTDIPVFTQLLKWVGVFDKYLIKLWPLGGDIMASLDLSLFENIKNVFAIIDSDSGSKKIRDAFMENCNKSSIPVFQLKRYAIENYFTIDAIRAVFPEIDPDKTKLTNNTSVDTQIGFKEKGKSIKAKNHEIIEQMSLSDFEDTDLLEVIKDIQGKIESSLALSTVNQSDL